MKFPFCNGPLLGPHLMGVGATLSNHFGFKDQLLEGAGAILVDNIPTTSLDLQISEPPKSHGHSYILRLSSVFYSI